MRKRVEKPGQVRIIGGQWRGRKLPVPDVSGLRPTGDRGRETLFNWLQSQIPGSHCADLFAGSGALGFEAASRGAAYVDLVEISPLVVSSLLDSCAALNAENVRVHRANVLDWLSQAATKSMDVVFVDPPFDSGLAIQVLVKIREIQCMREGGHVYVESSSRFPELVMDAPFSLVRTKTIGESRLQLFQRTLG